MGHLRLALPAASPSPATSRAADLTRLNGLALDDEMEEEEKEEQGGAGNAAVAPHEGGTDGAIRAAAAAAGHSGACRADWDGLRHLSRGLTLRGGLEAQRTRRAATCS